jgi:5-methyltetrahydropteroyltriglutamate--homocysteine methyltransferase
VASMKEKQTLEPIRTTTIGAFPKPPSVTVPDWFINPDTPDPTRGWAEAVAALGDRAEAVFSEGTRSAVLDQVNAGVDIPTDGEIRRENYIHYHCRHLQGFDFDDLTEKSVRGGNYTAWLPTVRGPLATREHFLARDYRTAQGFTSHPVKITLPGPLTIADTTCDAYYQDPRRLGRALAECLNEEVLALAQAGCRHIQIDEPVFARKADAALDYGLDHLERAFHGCPPEVTRTVHLCCGYPDRLDNPDYPKAPQSAYHQLARALDEAAVDAVSLEDAHRHNDLSLLELFQRTTVILGVVAVARSRVEGESEIGGRIRAALEHIPRQRLMVAPDCGLGLLGRDLAVAKLEVMCRAARAA